MADSRMALRAEALESLLIEKGLGDADRIEETIAFYNERVGPMNGAQVVARAWRDAAFKERLLEEGTAAIQEFGFSGGSNCPSPPPEG